MNINTNYKSRIESIDLLRGVVIMLMALDHVRDFLGPTLYDPLDLSQTSIALFFTRWITNLCAPTFVFLIGVSAYLFSLKNTKKELSLFLLKRGLFLTILDITLISYLWSFSFFTDINFQVFSIIGTSMIILAALCWLPRKIILFISIILIFCHNLFDHITIAPHTCYYCLWSYLHFPHGYKWHQYIIYISYPLIPWPGVMALGYYLGSWASQSVAVRTKKFFIFGVSCLILFVALRSLNFYGDAQHWSPQARGLFFSFLSFISTTKYPPSLDYILLNLGIITILWPLWEKWKGAGSHIILTFGKVALFFYLVHILLIHLLAVMYSKAILHVAPGWWWDFDNIVFPSNYHPSLTRVYLMWVGVLAVLYPLCAAYKTYKETHRYAWLKYF